MVAKDNMIFSYYRFMMTLCLEKLNFNKRDNLYFIGLRLEDIKNAEID